MDANLAEIAKKLSSPPGVIVAADESPSTMKSRFDKVGIIDSLEMRAKWRELIANAPIADAGATGIILHPEMLDIAEVVEPLKKQNIVIIVKIDGGLVDFGENGEQTTKFADDLAALLIKWRELGAAATKFRSVFKISDSTPTPELITANAKVQATLAQMSQNAGLVPMIEPEVLRNGTHNLATDAEVTSRILDAVFNEVRKTTVNLATSILKPNMITSGEDSGEHPTVDEVAVATFEVLRNHTPKELSGINFLSGGISDELSEQYLNRICRAIVGTPLAIWAGEEKNTKAAQDALVDRVKRSSLARQGKL